MERIENEHGQFDVHELCGWGVWDDEVTFNEDATRAVLGEVAAAPRPWLMPALNIVGGGYGNSRRMMLWEVARKLLGQDPPNYAQQVGDCVSFGAKNAFEYLQAFEIANGDRETWKRVFPPYLYGTGRVQVGGGRLGGDGSLGSWQAEAVMKYGTIPIDAEGCPEYSGSVARQWGRRPGPPEKFLAIGKQHLIQSAALVSTWDEVVAAVCNGYPVTIASNAGFQMRPGRDGFHERQGRWPHQMCIIGVDDDGGGVEPHACILNSWGDAHGEVSDFRTKERWPVGTLRARRQAIEGILSARESFAFSSFAGFPARSIPRDLCDPW